MNSDIITLAHGSGGKMMQELIAQELLPLCDEELGRGLEDAAELQVPGERLIFTTDSFTVQPLEFPGGDIGKLCICGTVNDLAMRGARPLYISLSLIIEEGLEFNLLRRVLASIGNAARETGAAIVTGDTKVVQRGKADGLFINTTGIGEPLQQRSPGATRALVGDKVLLNGPLGEHGIAVLVAREDLQLQSELESDCAALAGLVEAMLQVGGEAVHVLRDPTRGGLAAALNEIATASQVGIETEESYLPRNPAVTGACEILGLEPLEVANEGKLVAMVAPEVAEKVLAAMKEHPLGRQSAIIGEVVEGDRVTMKTALGTSRIIDMPSGELLPRIC